MASPIALFWPGDLRQRPNQLAEPNAEEATRQLERALTRHGRQTYRVPGFLSKPHEAIEKLGPIQDPMIGVCVHWFYGPHTTEGVVGKDNPLLLASNFSGQWPGLVGLLNTGACLEGPLVFTHRAIRPTIESLLGLSPHGPVLPGVLPVPPPSAALISERTRRAE